jgi:hypothetical protein
MCIFQPYTKQEVLAFPAELVSFRLLTFASFRKIIGM